MKRFVFFLMLVLALVACNGATPDDGTTSQGEEDSEQAGENLTHFKFGSSPFLSSAPIYIALEEGFFSDEGLDVELVNVTTLTQGAAALASGELDASTFGLIPAAINLAVESGGRFVAERGFLDPQASCAAEALMARAELLEGGFLEDPANVAGLRASTAVSSTFEYAFDAKLKQLGLTQADLQMIAMDGQATRLEAMFSGALDIANFVEPFIATAVQSGDVGIWAPMADVVPYAPVSAIFYGADLMQNEDLGRRFMLGYLRGVQQYLEGKTDRNLEIIAKYIEMDPEQVRGLCWNAIRPDGNADLDAWMAYLEWMVEKDYLDAAFSPEQIWDSRFIDYANAQIGE